VHENCKLITPSERKIGNWTLLYVVGVSKNHAIWRVRCMCGREKNARTDSLCRSQSCGCSRRLLIENGTAERNAILCAYRNIARKRNLEWSLDGTVFDTLMHSVCFYCSCPPSNKRQNRGGGPVFVYSGIDRKDNNIGYTVDNVVSCCIVCNRAKNKMSVIDFLNWVRRVHERVKTISL